MKHLIFCSTFLLTVPVHAQSWCAPEAVWFHDYPYTAFGDYGYVETRYTGQVLFADSVCEAFSIMEHGWSDQTNTPWEGGPFTRYTHTGTDGLVQLWTGSGFDTLFHFGSVPGDRWYFPVEWSESGMLISVTDTGHTLIANASLRHLVVEATLEDIVFVADTIYERIGPIELYLDAISSTYFLIDGGYGGLRCYSDAEMELSRVDGPCEIALWLTAHLDDEVITVSVSPNPSNGPLHIELTGTNWRGTSITIRDAQGRTVAHSNMSGTMQQLDLSGLAAGCYVVSISDIHGVRHNANWLKE